MVCSHLRNTRECWQDSPFWRFRVYRECTGGIMTLTEKSIAKIAPAKDRAHFHDNQVTGFGLRVASIADGGRKSFFWRAKIGGQQKFCPLGEYPFVSVTDARDAAKKLVGQAAAWRQAGFTSPDPFQKEKRVERASVPTFRELCESYIENYLRANALTPQRAEYDVRLLLKNHLSAWLDKPLDAITVDDMLTVKNACGKHRHMANSCVEFARRVYNWSSGSEDGKLNFWKCANPAKDVSLYPHGKTTARKRFLQPNELLRF